MCGDVCVELDKWGANPKSLGNQSASWNLRATIASNKSSRTAACAGTPMLLAGVGKGTFGRSGATTVRGGMTGPLACATVTGWLRVGGMLNGCAGTVAGLGAGSGGTVAGCLTSPCTFSGSGSFSGGTPRNCFDDAGGSTATDRLIEVILMLKADLSVWTDSSIGGVLTDGGAGGIEARALGGLPTCRATLLAPASACLALISSFIFASRSSLPALLLDHFLLSRLMNGVSLVTLSERAREPCFAMIVIGPAILPESGL